MKNTKIVVLSLIFTLMLNMIIPLMTVVAVSNTTNLSVNFRDGNASYGKVQYSLNDGATWNDVTKNIENLNISVSGDNLRLKIVPNSNYSVDYAGISLNLDGTATSELSEYGLESDDGYSVPANIQSVALEQVEFREENGQSSDNNQNNGDNSYDKIILQLDGATVSGNVITFNYDDTEITATVSGTGYSFDGNNLEVNVDDINNVKLVLSNNFDSSKMSLKLHNGQTLGVSGDNEAIFDGLDFSQDNSPHLGLYLENNNSGQVGGSENILFNITVNDTYALVDINGKEVVGDSDVYQDTYTFNNVLVEQAGETDPTKTNVIKITPRFGEHDIIEFIINNVTYTLESENVEYYDYGWFITVPGADSYVITVTGDVNSDTQRTIIWVNPDYVPENEEDAEWVKDFTISHGTAKVIEVYDKDDNLVSPDTYTDMDADEYGLHDGFGWVAIYPGSRVVFEFVPEYGYQLTGITINETPLDAIDGNENMNRFEVILPAENAGNLHFAATFTKTEDIVKANSDKVESGEITLGNQLESGSAQLTVSDVELSSDKIKGFENAAGDYTISKYLDIDLYNVYYKGKNDANDVWTNKISELDKEATITLKLADGITADDIVMVHNIHDGDEYEIIEIESYDVATNTITFKTKSFSNYAIATKTTSTEETTTDTSGNPTTGDNIIMIISIFAIAALGVFTTLKINKNRRIRKH